MGERPQQEAPRPPPEVNNSRTPDPASQGDRTEEQEHIDPDRLLTVEQAAELLGLHRRTVQAFLNNQELIGVRIGRIWRVARADLRTFIACHRSGKT